MTSRYWVIKAPDGTLADNVLNLLNTLSSDRLNGVELVEVTPEQRTLGWAEKAILEKFGPKK